MLKRRGRATGQALAEFAMVAPILFLLLFGVIQIGLVMADQNGLVNGVRDAARRAATYRVNADSFSLTVFSSICSAVDTTLVDHLKSEIPGFEPALLSSSIEWQWEQDPVAGQYFLVAQVTASYKNPLYVPLISFFFDARDGVIDNKIQLDASEQMRVENPPLDLPASTSPESCT